MEKKGEYFMKRNTWLRLVCVAVLLVCLLAQPLVGVSADTAKAGVSERNYYGVTLDQFKLGYSGWGDKITISKSDVSGVTFTFKGASSGMRGGMTRAFALDGFHITFDRLRDVDPKQGKFYIAFSNKSIPDHGTGHLSLMFWIDTMEGKITTHPSNNVVIQDDALKADNLKNKEWGFEISAPDANGDRTVTVAGVSGTLQKAWFDAANAITDTSAVYFALSGVGAANLTFDVVAVHDGNNNCLGGSTKTDYNTQFYEVTANDLMATEWTGGTRLTCTKSKDKGISVVINSASTATVHTSLAAPVKLNGTKLYFDKVSLTGMDDDASTHKDAWDNLCILLSGEPDPSGYAGKAGAAGAGVNGFNTLLTINFTTGQVYTFPHDGGKIVIDTCDLIKGLANGKTPFSVQFSGETASEMTLSIVTDAGSVSGVMTKSVSFGTSFRNNTSKVYLAFGQQASNTGIKFDLCAVKGGADKDYVLTAAEYAELMLQTGDAQKVIAAIDALGKVTGDDAFGKKLASVRAAYNALSDSHKWLVNNLDELEAAESAYATLKAMNTPVKFDDKNIVLKLGAITDTHNTKHFPATFETISNYLGGKPDAILSAGDITDAVIYYNSTAELPVIKQTYPAVMGDVPYFFCLGNHDSAGGSHAQLFYDTLGDWFYRLDLDKEAARKQGNRYMKLGGYHFLAVEGTYKGTGYTTETVSWLENKLKAIVADKSYKGEYIFIITHSPVSGTVYGSDGDGYNGLSALLSKYPQALVLSGHSHSALADERSIMQTDFTSVHLGAIHYMSMPNQYLETKEPYLLGEQDSYQVSLGTAIEVDKNGNVRITRLDMLKGGQIKTQWLLPAPAKDGSHLKRYTAARADINEAPAFAKDAAGVIKKNGSGVQVRFTAADDDDMVFYYVIDVLQNGNSKPVKTYKTLSRFYNYPDVDDMPSVHYANISNFSYTDCTLRITAVDSWGAESQPLLIKATASDADIAAAGKVDDLIKAIGTVTLNSKAAVEAAETAYKALSGAQKALVTKYDTLTAARKTLNALLNPGQPEQPTVKPGQTTEAPDNDPKTDAPGIDDPSTDEPSTDNPSTDEPLVDNPSTDEPSVDNPSTDAPSVDDSSSDTPADNANGGNGWLIIVIVAAVLVVAGGTVAVILFIRKRK